MNIKNASRAIRTTPLLFLLMIGLPGTSHAELTCEVAGNLTGYANSSQTNFDHFDITFNGQIDHGITLDNVDPSPNGPSLHLRASAAAGPGWVGGSTYSEWIDQSSFHDDSVTEFTSGSNAASTMTDLFTPGTPGTTATATLNLVLTGAGLDATSYRTASGAARATASLVVYVLINNTIVDAGVLEETSIAGAGPTLFSSGLLAGAGPNTNLITSSYSVPVGEKYTCTLRMTTYAAVEGQDNESFVIDARSDFFHTLSFPADRPVMNLPEGYTLYSDEGNIVDNHFIGGASSAAAPEPAALPLALLGLAPLGIASHRRRIRS